jgi:hypothetical protein
LKVPVTISIEDSILNRINTAARTKTIPRSRIFQTLITRGLVGTEEKPLILEEVHIMNGKEGCAQDPLATNTKVPASLSSSSMFPQPRIIRDFTLDRETLEYLKATSPLHYLVAVACLKDGRWRLVE